MKLRLTQFVKVPRLNGSEPAQMAQTEMCGQTMSIGAICEIGAFIRINHEGSKWPLAS